MAKTTTLKITKRKGETDSQALARVALNPVVDAAETITKYDSAAGDGPEIWDLIKELDRSINATLDQERMYEAQSLLVAQANVLNSIFHQLAGRAAANMGHYLEATDTFMKLALRAQSQCRATLQTVSEIRNPKLASVVKQANIAGGHQQVNNLPAEGEIPPNELLEHEKHERLDFAAPSETGGEYSELEALGESDRPKNCSRKA